MNKAWLLAIPALTLELSLAQAGDIDCNDPQDQTSMNICAYEDWQAADRELNELWPQIRTYMRETDSYLDEDLKGAEKALLKAQRAWIEYRDGNCDAEGFQARGGTLEPLIVSSCLAHMTRERIKQLKGLRIDR